MLVRRPKSGAGLRGRRVVKPTPVGRPGLTLLFDRPGAPFVFSMFNSLILLRHLTILKVLMNCTLLKTVRSIDSTEVRSTISTEVRSTEYVNSFDFHHPKFVRLPDPSKSCIESLTVGCCFSFSPFF